MCNVYVRMYLGLSLGWGMCLHTERGEKKRGERERERERERRGGRVEEADVYRIGKSVRVHTRELGREIPSSFHPHNPICCAFVVLWFTWKVYPTGLLLHSNWLITLEGMHF